METENISHEIDDQYEEEESFDTVEPDVDELNETVDSTLFDQSLRGTEEERVNEPNLNNDYGIRRVDMTRVSQQREELIKNLDTTNLKEVIDVIVLSLEEYKFRVEAETFRKIESEYSESLSVSKNEKSKFEAQKRKMDKKKLSYEKKMPHDKMYIECKVTFDSDLAQAQYEKEEHFKLAYYVQTLKTKYKFGKSIAGDRFQQISYSSVLFFYRVKPFTEIFYIVNNKAWQAMDWCADYDFPISMCRRLLTLKGPSSRKAKPLSGNIAHEDVIYREAERIVNIFRPAFEYNIRAHFRENCSIFRLFLPKNVDNTTGPVTRKKDFEILMESLKAEVGETFFKLAKHLSIADFIHLCHHFSIIYSKKSTKLLTGDEETDTDVYDKLFQPVKSGQTKLLDQQLVKMLFEKRTEENEYISNQFIFVHPKAKDFDIGKNQTLVFEEKPPITVALGKYNLMKVMEIVETQLTKSVGLANTLQQDESLSVMAMVKARLTNANTSPEYLETKVIEKTLKLIRKIKVTFEKNSIPQENVSILRCIGGFMQGADDHFLYWRIHGKWYEVKQDLVAKAHQAFIELLNGKGYLLTENDVEFLKYKWLGKTQEKYFRESRTKKEGKKNDRLEIEGIFNAMFGYVNRGRFIVGDKICFDGIELFDVMEIKGKGKSEAAYLYHVKRGFNTATREACAQIQNAFRIIKNPSKSNFKELEKFYEIVKTNSQNQNIFKNVSKEKFVELLQKATFVYAVFDDSKRQSSIPCKYEKNKKILRSLLQEKTTQPVVSVKKLESLLKENSTKGDVSGLTLDELKKMLNITRVQSGFQACAKRIQDMLVGGDYIDEQHKATKKFLTEPIKDFQLQGISKMNSETILKILNQFRSAYLCATFVPHLEIIRTWLDLRDKFAICEIIAEGDGTPPNDIHKLLLKKMNNDKTDTQPTLLSNTQASQFDIETQPASSGYSTMSQVDSSIQTQFTASSNKDVATYDSSDTDYE